MYTYGAPRTGNKTFADAFGKAVPDAWRLSNSNDIIPSVPRLAGYCHVQHGVKLTPEGKLRFEDSDVFGEGKTQLEVISELVDKAQREEEGIDEVFKVRQPIAACCLPGLS